MTQTTVKIGGKTYSVEFTFGAMRLLAKKLGYNSFGDVQQKMIDLKFDKIKSDLSFEQWDFLGATLSAGIEAHPKNKGAKVSEEICTEMLFNNIEKAIEVIQIFSAAVFKRLGKQQKVQPATRKKK